MIQLLGVGGIAVPGAVSGAAAADSPVRQRDGGVVTVAEGTSGYVTSDEETPGWVDFESTGSPKLNVGDMKRGSAARLTADDQLNCEQGQFDWEATLKNWDVEFLLQLDVCTETCSWEFQIEALDQSVSTGVTDQCDSAETFSGGEHPLHIEGEVYPGDPAAVEAAKPPWVITVTIQYFDPFDWQWEEISFDINLLDIIT